MRERRFGPIVRRAIGLMAILISGFGQTGSASDPCGCYTPARNASCPTVRFGYGDCPGSRDACDWCYGPDGVFAYAPRSRGGPFATRCTALGAESTWSTRSDQVMGIMKQAGGACASNGKGGYLCKNVDPVRYKDAAKCGAPKKAP